MSDVIVFHGLTRPNLENIIDMELAKVRDRLKERHIILELTKEARDFLMEKGYNPDLGARPLRRVIENLVEEPLSEELLRGAFKEHSTIRAELTSDDPKRIRFEVLATDTNTEEKKEEEPVTAGN